MSQSVIVFVIVAAAIGYAVYRIVRRGGNDSGGCNGCNGFDGCNRRSECKGCGRDGKSENNRK